MRLGMMPQEMEITVVVRPHLIQIKVFLFMTWTHPSIHWKPNRVPDIIRWFSDETLESSTTWGPKYLYSRGARPSKHGYVPYNDGPRWNQLFNIHVAHHAAEVHFLVKDSDTLGSQLIGVVVIPVDQIYGGSLVDGSFPLLNTSGKPFKNGACLGLSIQYIPIEKQTFYHNGVGAGPEYSGIPDTYFPLRRGGQVTLYQDAHVPCDSLPTAEIDGGMHYVHGTCWVDIFNAIKNAKRLVYITGWSVWHEVRLVREVEDAPSYTLGDLLKTKSQEGVKVLLLVWDDPTSRNIMGYKMDGLMGTHDEETKSFFKNSSVQVMLCPRMAGKKHSWVKKQ
ncbi:hypothetical protein OSB04_008629, partial [Centaurea solstitialis]